jgi:hypothetical protein
VEEDIAATRSPRDPEGDLASVCYFLRDRVLNGLPRDAFFIRGEARGLAARVINPVAREQGPAGSSSPRLGGRRLRRVRAGRRTKRLDVLAQDAELLVEDDLAARGLDRKIIGAVQKPFGRH